MDGATKNGAPSKDPDQARLDLERERFEFEKSRQEQQSRLELGKLKQARLDSWLRVAGTIFIGGLISAAITIYGINSENKRTERADKLRVAENERAVRNGKSETFIRLVSARESANTSLRARMFEALLSHFFQAKDEKSRITMLELIGLNFRDAIEIRPIFEHLDRELDSDNPDRALLKKAVRSIINDQLDVIREARDGVVCESILKLKDEPSRPDCFSLLSIELTDINTQAGVIRIRANSRRGHFVPQDDQENRDQFSVGFFDMPMTDYTTFFNVDVLYKYSIVLNKILDDDRVSVSVAVLPADAISSHQRYKFDELLADYAFFLE